MYQKLFFPIGGGEELEERLFGSLLVAKELNSHLDILASKLDFSRMFPEEISLPGNLLDDMVKATQERCDNDLEKSSKVFYKYCKDLDIEVSQTKINGKTTAFLDSKVGYRSELVAQMSKFCDLVIAAAPPGGVKTSTFEAAVVKSGKPVIVIPRVLKKFKMEKILISWNNSVEASRSLSFALPFLKNTKSAHIITTKQFTKKDIYNIENLVDYLEFHDIKATYEVVKTTKTPGEALYNNSKKGEFDLVIAGAYGHQSLMEKFLGGATGYLLKKMKIPIFMSN